jgi:hypothetical protein
VFKTYSASFLSTTDVSVVAPSRNHGSIDGSKDKGMDYLRVHAHSEENSPNEKMYILQDDNLWKQSQK